MMVSRRERSGVSGIAVDRSPQKLTDGQLDKLGVRAVAIQVVLSVLHNVQRLRTEIEDILMCCSIILERLTMLSETFKTLPSKRV